jgi:hypothetical protein
LCRWPWPDHVRIRSRPPAGAPWHGSFPDLTALSRAGRLEATGLTAFDELRAGDLTDEAVTELEAVAAGIEAVRGRIGEIDEAAAARAARVEALAGQIAPVAAVVDPEDEDETPPAEPAVVAEPVEGVIVEQVAASGVRAVARRAAPSAVVANARRSGVQVPLPNTAGGVALLAAAGAPGHDNPGPITLDQMAEIAVRRWSGYPAGSNASPDRQMRATHGVATIRKHFEPSLIADGGNDMAVIAHAINTSRLPGGSLVAAGGWCAPSETLYDLCQSARSTECSPFRR